MKITVENIGTRLRERAGYRFKPGETRTVEVPAHAVLAVSACVDLRVQEDTPAGEGVSDDQKPTVPNDDFSALTADEVLQLVAADEVTAFDALGVEQAGKNRKVLVKDLEALVNDVQGEND